MSRLRAVGVLLVAGLLAACGSVPQRVAQAPVDVEVAQAAQRERQVQLARFPNWSLQGRVAISQQGKGGNGRIDWSQQGTAYRIALSAPVTRQSWQLSGEPGGATLEGLDGGPRSGPDATELLWQSTGWLIPVEGLADWVRGLAAGDAQVSYGEDGHLRRIVAAGWTVEYQAWQPAADGFPAMPTRIQAERDGARVRLLVDRWMPMP